MLKTVDKLLQTSKISPGFDKAETTVAILAGPSLVIESVVAKAEQSSGIKMDWCYQGGRAFVQALGDRKKARSAIYCAIPNSNLTQADL